jgi:DHA2 family multidrug resistance protein-like MFS transporter
MRRQEVSPKATLKEWLGLGIVGLTSLVVAIDLFVMLLALPAIGSSLHASPTQLLWITDMYGFLLSGFMITMGTLGDRIGRRKVLMIGSAGFAIASLLVAFAQSAPMLIASRAMLGIAGAMIAPAALSLIRHMFIDPKENARAISIWLSCLIGGSILGPIVGGILLQHFWWGSVFLVGVAPMVLALLLGKKVLPEYKNPEASKLHIASVALSLAAILPLMYGIKEIAAYGWHALPIVALCFGVACGLLFLRQQKRLSDPLLDLSLFKKPAFTLMLTAMLINTMLPGGVMVLTTQYLQLVAGFSPLHAGLWMIPAMAASILGFLVSPRLVQRIRARYLIALGLCCSILGMAILCFTSVDGGIVPLLIGFALFNLGAGPLVTLGTGMVIGAAPHQKAGAVAAISQTSNEFGFALGIGIVGSIGTAVYHTMLGPLPYGTPEDVAHTVRESLTSAARIADTLPAPFSTTVLHSARSAFVQEYHVAALLSGFALAIVAIAIIAKIKDSPELSKD